MARTQKTAYQKPLTAAALAVLLAGGSYGGYRLIRDNQADLFENSVHRVVHVVDGDTIDIDGLASSTARIRLLGIDAPESGTCYASESTAALKTLISGKDIRIEKDVSGTDRYGRYLRYVFLPSDDPAKDDIFVDEQLVEQGDAQVLPIAPDTRYRDLLARAQADAQKAKRGLWSSTCPYLKAYQATAAAALREQGSSPADPSCDIKGNISEKGYGKEYFLAGCPDYNRVTVDARKGEAWFCTEAAAKAAGFARSASCDTTFK